MVTKPPPKLFELTDHVCRACFGRVVKGRRPEGNTDDHAHTWTCTNCGAEHVSRVVSSVCACGLRLKPLKAGGNDRDAGVRCVRNAHPTPEFPSVIVAEEQADLREADAPAPKVRKPRIPEVIAGPDLFELA